MDIDDEFQSYMRLVHPKLEESHPQYGIQRATFFGGMMAVIGLVASAKNPRKTLSELIQVEDQLRLFANRLKPNA